jgi:hypothetical protein
MSLQNIKQAIKTDLDTLVTDGTLAGATMTDIRHSPLAADIPGLPHAYLMPPSVESDVLDNRTVLRTYSFQINILFNAEDLASTSDVENMMEAILNKFDNDPTLGNTAPGGMLPVSSAPEPTQHNGKDLILVVILLRAKEPVSLSF